MEDGTRVLMGTVKVCMRSVMFVCESVHSVGARSTVVSEMCCMLVSGEP